MVVVRWWCDGGGGAGMVVVVVVMAMVAIVYSFSYFLQPGWACFFHKPNIIPRSGRAGSFGLVK